MTELEMLAEILKEYPEVRIQAFTWGNHKGYHGALHNVFSDEPITGFISDTLPEVIANLHRLTFRLQYDQAEKERIDNLYGIDRAKTD